MSDTGGEPACWAHLLEDGDPDADMIRLRGGETIGHHVNDRADLLVITWQGTGDIQIGDLTFRLTPGVTTIVPRGISHAIRAGHEGLRCLTIER